MSNWVTKIGVEPSMTEAEKQNNAYIIWGFFAARGYTIEAVSGLLGNMDQESQINPGCKETASDQSGWGLIQWTPASNYFWWFNFHGWDFFDGDAQCEKIAEEIENNRDPWLPTSQYPYSGYEWSQLTDIEEATRAYFAERERGDPAQAHMQYRIDRANYWNNYLGGQPTPPTPPTPPPAPTPSEVILLAAAFMLGAAHRRK